MTNVKKTRFFNFTLELDKTQIVYWGGGGGGVGSILNKITEFGFIIKVQQESFHGSSKTTFHWILLSSMLFS